MKMTEFRSQQPLNDDDFAAIRRNVMTTIAARNERRLFPVVFPVVMRVAIAAAVIIAIGISLVPRRARRRPLPHHKPRGHRKRAPARTDRGACHDATAADYARVAHRPPSTGHYIELARQNIRVEPGRRT
jgi:hypothetical protein